MSTPNRLRRPELERSAPIRSWFGLFGAPSRASNGQAPGQREGPAATAVPRGVDLGYRVVEEYMKQGQDMARAMWPAAGVPRLASIRDS